MYRSLQTLIILWLGFFAAIHADTDSSQLPGLAALYSAWTGTPWSQSPTCDNAGFSVMCDSNGFVMMIAIPYAGVTGTLPTEIGLFTHLTMLMLEGNHLSGPIPTEIGLLTRLDMLHFTGNHFTGPIPTEIGNIGTSITELQIDGTTVSGPLPTEIGRLTNLMFVRMGNNPNLDGPLPTELGYLTHAMNIWFYSNAHTGSIPTELALCASDIWLNNNHLTGSIPTEFANSNAVTLDISHNNLDSVIPTELGKSLHFVLKASYNKLRSPIPANFAPAGGSMSDLSNNCFSMGETAYGADTIASDCSTTGTTGTTFASGTTGSTGTTGTTDTTGTTGTTGTTDTTGTTGTTDTTGTTGTTGTTDTTGTTGTTDTTGTTGTTGVPSVADREAAALSAIFQHLNGTFWEKNSNWNSHTPNQCNFYHPWFGVVCNNSRVIRISLTNNGLSGSLPDVFDHLASLEYLDLRNNSISGGIPPSLWQSASLKILHLGGNRISGGIEDITNMTNLLLLDLSTNALTGGITDNLLDQTGLMWINIADNALTGCLPDALQTFDSSKIRLTDNYFSCPAPGWSSANGVYCACNSDGCVIYATHFQTSEDVPEEWVSDSTLSVTTVADEDVLVSTDHNDQISLILAFVPPHAGVQFEFDLYIMGPWDGASDSLSITGQVLGDVDTEESLFSGIFSASGDGDWSQPPTNYTVEHDLNGTPTQKYHFTLYWEHWRSSLQISWKPSINTGGASWGLNNMKVVFQKMQGGAFLMEDFIQLDVVIDQAQLKEVLCYCQDLSHGSIPQSDFQVFDNSSRLCQNVCKYTTSCSYDSFRVLTNDCSQNCNCQNGTCECEDGWLCLNTNIWLQNITSKREAQTSTIELSNSGYGPKTFLKIFGAASEPVVKITRSIDDTNIQLGYTIYEFTFDPAITVEWKSEDPKAVFFREDNTRWTYAGTASIQVLPKVVYKVGQEVTNTPSGTEEQITKSKKSLWLIYIGAGGALAIFGALVAVGAVLYKKYNRTFVGVFDLPK